MIWSWVGISVVTLAVAYSMAEICSAYPVAGGSFTNNFRRQDPSMLKVARSVFLGGSACSTKRCQRVILRDRMVHADW